MRSMERSGTNRLFLGVCGGLAENLNISAIWLRIAFLVALMASGLGIAIYLMLALIMAPPGFSGVPFIQRMRDSWRHTGLWLKESSAQLPDRLSFCSVPSHAPLEQSLEAHS